MRWAYVKNGNVAEQLREIGLPPDDPPGSGPNAFLGDLVARHYGEPMLMVSAGDRKDSLDRGDIRARVFRKRTGGESSTVAKAAQRAGMFLSCLALLLRFRPDRILCGRRDFLLWPCHVASRLLRVPLVVSRHGMLGEGPPSGPVRHAIDAMHMRVLRGAAAIVCHGPFLKQQLVDRDIPAHKVHVFDVVFRQDGTEPRMHPALQAAGIERFALFAGRVEKVKGVFDLLDAMEERLRRPAGPGLVFAGKGRALEPLREEIRRRGLEGRAICLGRLSHKLLMPLVGLATVLVTPTQSCFLEGRCMSAMEGLATGVPVIAPDFGPFPWLVRHEENGLLFRPDSVPDLKTQLDRIMDDAGLLDRLRKGAAHTARDLAENTVTFGMAVNNAFGQSP